MPLKNSKSTNPPPPPPLPTPLSLNPIESIYATVNSTSPQLASNEFEIFTRNFNSTITKKKNHRTTSLDYGFHSPMPSTILKHNNEEEDTMSNKKTHIKNMKLLKHSTLDTGCDRRRSAR